MICRRYFIRQLESFVDIFYHGVTPCIEAVAADFKHYNIFEGITQLVTEEQHQEFKKSPIAWPN